MPPSSKKGASSKRKHHQKKGCATQNRKTALDKWKRTKQKQTDSEDDDSCEEIHQPRKKHTKQPQEIDVDADASNSSDTKTLDKEDNDSEGNEIELAIPAAIISKKDMAKDIRLLFSNKVKAKFLLEVEKGRQGGKVMALEGRWCSPCLEDEALIEKSGEQKAFITGGNSTCRQHARQHYTMYTVQGSRSPRTPLAIPREIWRAMEEEKNAKVRPRQGKLDGVVQKVVGPKEFSREGLRHAITQFVTCDDQSLAVSNKLSFRNCLVMMRPKTTDADLPTTHDILNHLHNEFVKWLQQLKTDIEAAPGLISTTADGWSVDTTKASFLGVTAHWIEVEDDKWKMRSEVIGFRAVSGEHSGANLGRHFMAVCQRIGIIDSKRSKLLTATLDNVSNNTVMCATIEDLHRRRGLEWDSKTNQLPCLGHVVNLGNQDVMAHITRIAAVEMTTAIWEYDPLLPDNRLLNGSLDVIAAIRSLTVKIQASGQRVEIFHRLQIECGIAVPLKIPLHSNVRWGTAFRMLETAYKLRQPIDLFISTADQRYGPITTIRHNGQIVKHILWSAFLISDADWERAKEGAQILADSNRIQEYVSAKRRPTLWRALPAIEELQTAWENKAKKASFIKYHDVIASGLDKIMKYYSRFDEKPAYVIGLALHPYYKLAYIELAWGGAKEQEAERGAGNPDAKNWQDEARQILETKMEHYWQLRSTTLPPSSMTSTYDLSTPPTSPIDNDFESMASDFDRHRRSLMTQGQEGGWEAELRWYLKDLPPNVTKDTDVVEWWQDNGYAYPTMRHIALDFLPYQASSVPCEQLFSGGGEIATKRRARLGADRFEELQMMKFAWRNNIGDLAAWNSSQVEDVDDRVIYADMLVADEEQGDGCDADNNAFNYGF